MRRLKAGVVQIQHAPGDKASNLEKVEDFTRRAAAEGVELLAFPEMCLTGYWHVRKLSRGEIEELAEAVKDPEGIEAEFRGPKGREWLLRWLPTRAHDNGLFVLFANGVGPDDDEVPQSAGGMS